MPLTPYTATETPPQEKVLALKPKPLAWTSRVWRESPGRAVPLFKIDVRIEPRDIEDKALAQALRPFAAQLDKIAIYLLPSALSTSTASRASCSSTTSSVRPTAP
jgi:hypothetical protein